jgi:hypothetical protein
MYLGEVSFVKDAVPHVGFLVFAVGIEVDEVATAEIGRRPTPALQTLPLPLPVREGSVVCDGEGVFF